jgi:hypothetical protein
MKASPKVAESALVEKLTSIAEQATVELENSLLRIGDGLETLDGKAMKLKTRLAEASAKRELHRVQLTGLEGSFTTVCEGFCYGTAEMKSSLQNLAGLYSESNTSKDQLLNIIAVQQTLFLQLIEARWVGKPSVPMHSYALNKFTLEYCQHLPGKLPKHKRAWVEVLKFLDLAGIVRFSKTSNANYLIAYNEEIWEALYTRKFGHSQVEVDNWRLKYAYKLCNTCSVCSRLDLQVYVKGRLKYCSSCKMQLSEFKPQLSYYGRCNATTLRGTRCKRITRNSNGYCWQH